MIEGLKVTVIGSEVKELALVQAEFHRGKVEFYQKQIDVLSEAGFTAADMQKYSRADPKREVSEKAVEHRDKDRELQFIAAHLILTEQYLLGRDDLRVLGIVRGYR